MWDKSYNYHTNKKKRRKITLVERWLFQYRNLCYNVREKIFERIQMKKNTDNIIHIRATVPLEGEQTNGKINRKKQIIGIVAIVSTVVLASVVGILAYMQMQTYTDVKLIQSYGDVSVTNNRCEAFASGILRFGTDGVSYLDDEGAAIWNYSYEISNPIIETTATSAAIADIGGNLIVVMDESGVKGEIETVLPIEKVSVSEQGIVAVLVQDGSTPQVICYDAVGNILVEHKTSLSGTGYPIDMAMSKDGTILLVTYLQVSETGIVSSYVYYNFGDTDLVSGSQVASGEKSGTIIAETKFIDDETSVMITTEGLEIFVGTTEPELTYAISIEEEIQSVFYGEGQVGLIIENASGIGYEVRVYNSLGEILVAEEYVGEYTSVDIIDNQIILYEGYSCLIYSMQGILKFQGEMTMDLAGVFPVVGINKYVIVGSNGMEEIRLVR